MQRFGCKTIREDNTLLIKVLAENIKYTLVAYPVVHHYDTFRKGEHSLENKICLEYILNDGDADGDIGRGGSEPNKLVLSLLD